MALQTSGAISLNDMHIEAGGTSGTICTINDTDIRGLINKGSGATMSFNEWYGASNYQELDGQLEYLYDESAYTTTRKSIYRRPDNSANNKGQMSPNTFTNTTSGNSITIRIFEIIYTVASAPYTMSSISCELSRFNDGNYTNNGFTKMEWVEDSGTDHNFVVLRANATFETLDTWRVRYTWSSSAVSSWGGGGHSTTNGYLRIS